MEPIPMIHAMLATSLTTLNGRLGAPGLLPRVRVMWVETLCSWAVETLEELGGAESLDSEA